MADSASFTRLVPGFEFLQGLVKNAGAALPSIGQWVAPTLNPEELEKRIEELRTVQFWLEQNAKMLAATIQALEVQRMTLSTLKTMNVQMEDLREAMKIKVPPMAEPAAAPAEAPKPEKARPKATADAAAQAAQAATQAATAAMNAVDPMQWWGALTKQFTELAANAMKDTATDAAKNLASSMVKQGFDAAGQTLKAAAEMPAKAARAAGQAMSKATTGTRAAPAPAAKAAKPGKAAKPAAKKAARKRGGSAGSGSNAGSAAE
jgi:hypothetical protein